MSELSIDDVRLELDVTLINNKRNSGSQIRSQTIKNRMRCAYQCAAGPGMGDFHNDGLLDISAGSVWYDQPSKGTRDRGQGTGDSSPWKMHVLGEKANSFDIKTYGDTFMNWAEDLDGDGRQDLIVVDFPGKQTWWFQNPGSVGQASGLPWKKHVVVPVTNDESPLYLDGDGDGKRGLVYGDGANRIAIARPQ